MSAAEPLATIERVRFPVVLFDLDGTVIDSGAIILASMRHAAETVVGGEWSDAQLMQAVGGPGLEAQMVGLDPNSVDELVRVYRAHNEPLHDTLECCEGMDVVLAELKERGHRLGIVTAKRRVTVDLAFARLPIEHLFETVSGGDETERHKPDPAAAAARPRAPGRDRRARPPTSATRRSTCRPRRLRASTRSASAGAASTPRTSSSTPT